jgi:hypothetical protein
MNEQMREAGLTKMNECYSCRWKSDVPGNAHIACDKPDAAMIGNQRAYQKGWFFYPMLFDPVWKERDCSNFENRVSPAVSLAVSPETSK